jgi:hypothetical protein
MRNKNTLCGSQGSVDTESSTIEAVKGRSKGDREMEQVIVGANVCSVVGLTTHPLPWWELWGCAGQSSVNPS